MGCGCGKRSATPRGRALMPTIGPRSIPGGVAAGPTPSQLRVLNMQKFAKGNTPERPASPMTEQRRKLEKMRRVLLKRKMGG